MMNDNCVCCGKYVPEGRQVCPICENSGERTEFKTIAVKKGCGIMANNNPLFNSSGCKDPTAYEAIGKVIREENDLDKRVHCLINVLKFIIEWAGFELISRIEIKDKKTRKEFR